MTERLTDIKRAASAAVLEHVDQIGDMLTEKSKPMVDRINGRFDEMLERVEMLEAKSMSPGATVPRNDSREMKAFEAFVTKGEPFEQKTMSVGSSSDGGATVPKVIAGEIISRAIARSPLVSIVRSTVATTSDYRRILNLRGAESAWVGETDSRNDSDTPLLREITFPHGELAAVPVVTNWLLQDSQFNMEAFVRENIVDRFAKALEAAVVYGDASNKPKGLFASEPVARADGDSPERAQDVLELYDSADSPGNMADALIDLYFRVKPEYRQRGRWVMTSAQLATVRKLRDAEGSGFLWQANMGVGVDASDGMLLGKPVHISEEFGNVDHLNSPSLGTPILFGDFNVGYELVRIGDMTVVRDPYTAKGKVKFYFAQRFGGRIVDNDALKVLFV